MPVSQRFDFHSIDDLRNTIAELGVDIRLDEDLSRLWQRVAVGTREAPNALAVHPMEGCDGTTDGAPDELTVRRYRRYAGSGAGLIWFEATAIVAEGRSNAHQLWLSPHNVRAHAELNQLVRQVAREEVGPTHQPLLITQLTHSGRRTKTNGRPTPIVACHNPILDPVQGLPPDHPIISDDELEALEDRFVEASRLAWEAGFDGIDIKSCHGYLISELLAGHTRPGRYGGSFENRTRFVLNVVDKVREAVPDLLLTVRLNAFDGLEYPYGWGRSQADPDREDLEEPIKLTRLLYEKGVRLLNVSAGVPSHRPQLSRPSSQPGGVLQKGGHPLERIASLMAAARAIQQAVPEIVVMGTGYSWLREYFPYAAAGSLNAGWARMIGLGRLFFAYPSFPRDLLSNGVLNPRRVCLTCGMCAELLRADAPCGCTVRDASTYIPIYRRYCQTS